MGSNPTRAALFFSSEKKELFGLVAFPFFLFIEKSFHAQAVTYIVIHVQLYLSLKQLLLSLDCLDWTESDYLRCQDIN